ncbi:MAG: aminotransferase class I/II-fold pyridoxal phosphate-dependent enzyme [Chloroflexota bacterium]|nr:aminotransferase class I/II-fold pyridoxal phosphate-dependent enzyme [Chloroflexota bacterium]
MRIDTFQLERWMTTYELAVKYDIAESGIAPLTTNDLLRLLPEAEKAETLQRLLDLRLGYSEARGTEALRSTLAATYANTSPDNILITTGAIEANYVIFNSLLDDGDEVVVVDPAYQQLQSVPAAIGCHVSYWKPRTDFGFRYDVADLTPLVTDRTRLIVINTPHNPTGAALSADQLQEVYDLAEQSGALVLSDEAYRWLEVPGGAPAIPPIRNLGERGISVGTVSKPFGVPGLRIGWIAGPVDIVQKCWAMRDFITLSPGGLNDALALIAITHRDQIAARTRHIVEQNLDTAEAWFARNADLVSWTPPQGGLLSLMRFELDVPSYQLANTLAEEYSVMLAPGAAFGYEGYLRIGIGAPPEVFRRGLDETERCLRHLLASGVKKRS